MERVRKTKNTLGIKRMAELMLANMAAFGAVNVPKVNWHRISKEFAYRKNTSSECLEYFLSNKTCELYACGDGCKKIIFRVYREAEPRKYETLYFTSGRVNDDFELLEADKRFKYVDIGKQRTR